MNGFKHYAKSATKRATVNKGRTAYRVAIENAAKAAVVRTVAEVRAQADARIAKAVAIARREGEIAGLRDGRAEAHEVIEKRATDSEAIGFKKGQHSLVTLAVLSARDGKRPLGIIPTEEVQAAVERVTTHALARARGSNAPPHEQAIRKTAVIDALKTSMVDAKAAQRDGVVTDAEISAALSTPTTAKTIRVIERDEAGQIVKFETEETEL